MSETEPIFPGGQCVDHGCNHGLTKLEYFSLKIFCAWITSDQITEGNVHGSRSIAIKQARLLLREIDEAKGYK